MEASEDDKFTFVLGNSRYSCHRSLAEFISPFVSRMVRVDRACNEFTIDLLYDPGCFHHILDLMNGKSINISPEDASNLMLYAEKLGNTELYGILRDTFKSKLTKETAIPFLLHQIDAGLKYDDEITFIASNLSDFTPENLAPIPLKVLELIFSSPNLRIETEGDLYTLIRTLVTFNGSKYRVLYDYILYEYLTEAEINLFLSEISLSDVNEQLWDALSKRLRMKVSPHAQEEERHSEGTISFKTDPFAGIVSYLRELSGSNPSLNGLIDISYQGGNPYCDKLFEPGWKCYWSSTNAPGQWLNFEFKKHQIYLTEYTLKSPNSKAGWNHMKSWVIEGSDDGITWCEMDRREDNNDLNGKNRVMTWKCQNPQRVRNVRLRQIGKNHHNADDIQLTNIEFFGRLTEI